MPENSLPSNSSLGLKALGWDFPKFNILKATRLAYQIYEF